MPRRARKLSPTKIYHIVFRGINKQNIFQDNYDYQWLLKRLKSLKDETEFELYAYCLMTNHVHLLIKEKNSGDISLIMKRLLIAYAQYFNKKYGRIGKLINDRYLSLPVKNKPYIKNLVRYIHQNPVKIGLPIKYEWSSYNCYINKNTTLIDTDFIFNFINVDHFEEFNNILETIDFEPNDKLAPSDNEIIEDIIENYNINPKEIIYLAKPERDAKLSLLRNFYSISQISRITGISYSIIQHCKLLKRLHF